MSRKTVLKASLKACSKSLSKAYLTQEKYDRVCHYVAEAMINHGFAHLASAKKMSGKHVRVYVNARRSGKVGKPPSNRTLQNEVACIRQILRAAGRQDVANSPDLTNAKLGISGGSRIGRKVPMTQEQIADAKEVAEARDRPGLSAILDLCNVLGLRHKEAVMTDQQTMERWLREIAQHNKIHVTKGTKTGRLRWVEIFNADVGKEVLERALATAKKQGGYLVTKANRKSAENLKQALNVSRCWMHRNGILPHSLRYGFAREQIANYERLGHTSRDAVAATSEDLGHGSGRGRWVRSVYARTATEDPAA